MLSCLPQQFSLSFCLCFCFHSSFNVFLSFCLYFPAFHSSFHCLSAFVFLPSNSIAVSTVFLPICFPAFHSSFFRPNWPVHLHFHHNFLQPVPLCGAGKWIVNCTSVWQLNSHIRKSLTGGVTKEFFVWGTKQKTRSRTRRAKDKMGKFHLLILQQNKHRSISLSLSSPSSSLHCSESEYPPKLLCVIFQL